MLLFFVAVSAPARVLTTGRLGGGPTLPAVQARAARHFAFIDSPSPIYGTGPLVLYDAKGEEAPRVVYDQFGVKAAALREDDTQLAILACVVRYLFGELIISVDGGATWKSVTGVGAIDSFYTGMEMPDVGGSWVRTRYGPLRIGTHDVPFIFETGYGIYAITAAGEARLLLKQNPQHQPRIIGSSGDGSKVLIFGGTTLSSLDVSGALRTIGTMPSEDYFVEGWITPSGGAYVERRDGLYYVDQNTTTLVAGHISFTVPSADYAGAWIAANTSLSFHSPASGLVKQWDDPAALGIDALIPGASGKTLLIQRSGPAFAVWRTGDPPPALYDTMAVPDERSRTFLHVDPDAVARGEPIVFDTGFPAMGEQHPPVFIDQGTYRASLAQRLVLPSAARLPGAFDSFWKTDVTLYNPSDRRVNVNVHFSGDDRPLTLAPHEIRLVPDVLHTIFDLDSGGGPLFITPDLGATIRVTGRTYTTSAAGTYGFAADALDAVTAYGPCARPIFSGALLGGDVRTNLVLTSVDAYDGYANVTAFFFGRGETLPKPFTVPALAQRQINSVRDALGLPAAPGALVVAPARGEAMVSVVAIDNRTNDPTLIPPDSDLSVERIFPAVGHLDGANGSHFTTDLYLSNLSSGYASVELRATLWDGTELPGLGYGLPGRSFFFISDVLATIFKRSGIAQLHVRFAPLSSGAAGDPDGRSIRVAARTGGIFMPPLQGATTTLEILGTSLQQTSRTNLGVVDAGSATTPRARVDIVNGHGATIDSFETQIPAAGGVQINDVFHARGLPETNEPVLIRITVLNGTLGAYASMLDNGTNDASYFAATAQ